MGGQGFYIVTATLPRGTITYRCPTPEWALKKLRDLMRAERTDIAATAPDGSAITEADLVRLIAGGSSVVAGASMNLAAAEAQT